MLDRPGSDVHQQGTGGYTPLLSGHLPRPSTCQGEAGPCRGLGPALTHACSPPRAYRLHLPQRKLGCTAASGMEKGTPRLRLQLEAPLHWRPPTVRFPPPFSLQRRAGEALSPISGPAPASRRDDPHPPRAPGLTKPGLGARGSAC